MKTYLPYYCKKIGIVLVIIAIALSFIANINDFCEGFVTGFETGRSWKIDNYEKAEIPKIAIISDVAGKTFTWISLFLSFSGFLLYMFSREKVEDEFIQQLRFKSLAKSLLFTWIVVSILIIVNSDIQLAGLYILQFQLFIYVVIYNYYKQWRFI